MLHQIDHDNLSTTEWFAPASSVNWQHLDELSTTSETIAAFEVAMRYSASDDVPLSDERFDRVVDQFISHLPQLTANELLTTLQAFAQLPMNRTLAKQRNYIELCMAFDQHSTALCTQYTVDQLLLLCSIWFHVPAVDKTFLAKCACRQFNRRFHSMTRPQFVQSLYYVNCLGQRVDDMQTIERVFAKYVDELSMEEMAIVAWTFDLQEHQPNQRELKFKCFDRLDQPELGQLDGVFLSKLMPVSGCG